MSKVQEKLKEVPLNFQNKVSSKYVDCCSTKLAELTLEGRWGEDKLCSLYSPKTSCSFKKKAGDN